MKYIRTLRILRYTWVLLFVWFATQQLLHPEMWTVFLPEWTGYFPIPPEMLIQLNGWFEYVLALLLALGIWQRPVVAVLALHLFGIAIETGGAIGVRDAALAMIGVALLSAPIDGWPLGVNNRTKE
ncbi:DoxX family membrane protein [Candidatus Nomurabacteria bacterium]|nr:DoxX family membrane protein [Candidatus Nomurabacteria bacterium]